MLQLSWREATLEDGGGIELFITLGLLQERKEKCLLPMLDGIRIDGLKYREITVRCEPPLANRTNKPSECFPGNECSEGFSGIFRCLLEMMYLQASAACRSISAVMDGLLKLLTAFGNCYEGLYTAVKHLTGC